MSFILLLSLSSSGKTKNVIRCRSQAVLKMTTLWKFFCQSPKQNITVDHSEYSDSRTQQVSESITARNGIRDRVLQHVYVTEYYNTYT